MEDFGLFCFLSFTAMASATFNPFFYLQQLNNIFPNTGTFHNPLEMKPENNHAFKVLFKSL